MRKMERYDPRTNTWEEVAPMATARYGFSFAVLDDKLYAAGGSASVSADSLTFNSMERYDPSTNTWEELASMHCARTGFILCSY